MFGKDRSSLPKCPICFMSLDSHAFFDIGSAVLDSFDEARLTEAVNGSRWGEASQFQAANAKADIRVWRVFFCDGKALIFPMVSKFDIWEDDSYGEPIVISEERSLGALKQVTGISSEVPISIRMDVRRRQ
jgi:hypothetical protein